MPGIRYDLRKTSSDMVKTANDLTKVAQDAAYVAIGLGVLGFQRAQVRRRELRTQLGKLQTQGPRGRRGPRPATDLRHEFGRAVKEFDKTVVSPLIERWDATIDPVSERLPAGAKAAIKQARGARDQLRSYLTSLAA